MEIMYNKEVLGLQGSAFLFITFAPLEASKYTREDMYLIVLGYCTAEGLIIKDKNFSLYKTNVYCIEIYDKL